MLARVGQPYASTKGRDGGGLGLFLVANVAAQAGRQRWRWTTCPTAARGVSVTIPLDAIAWTAKDSPTVLPHDRNRFRAC